MTESDSCFWAGCSRPAVMTYLERPLCDKHWKRVCDLSDEGNQAHLTKMLGILKDNPQRADET
jgi:hypothetical protein